MSGPQKYRTKPEKPVVVEAMQYLGFDKNGKECEVWLGDSFSSHIPSRNEIEFSAILGGYLTASAADYIIRVGKDEFYPYGPDLFDATFEAAS